MSRITDYGIVLLAHLAGDHDGDTRNARELADEAMLPLPVASKVLKRLAHEGLLQSHRGAKGGYGLARPADEITVAQVIRALEGPVAITQCTMGPGQCDHESRCVVRSPWQRINEAIVEALERVTLSDLVDPPQGGFALPFDLKGGSLAPRPGRA